MNDKMKNLLTVPNLLSLSRILLIPVLIWFLSKNKPTTVFLVFLLAASTDFLDGISARIWQQKTRIGAYLDPVADKLLMTASFIVLAIPSLSQPNTLPVWLTAVVIGRDIVIVSGAFYLYTRFKQTNFDPTFLGKTSTICQMGVLLLVLLFNMTKTSPPILDWMYFLTLALTLLSFLNYVHVGIGMLARAKRR